MSRREDRFVLPWVILRVAPLSPSSTPCSSAWHCRQPAPCVGAPSAQHAWLWWPAKTKTAGQAQRDRLLTGFHLLVRDEGRRTLVGTKLQFVPHGPLHDEQTVPGRRARTTRAKAAQRHTPKPRHLPNLDLAAHRPGQPLHG